MSEGRIDSWIYKSPWLPDSILQGIFQCLHVPGKVPHPSVIIFSRYLILQQRNRNPSHKDK